MLIETQQQINQSIRHRTLLLILLAVSTVFLVLLNPGMNFSVSAVLRGALTLKFILQISNAVFCLGLSLWLLGDAPTSR